MFTKKYNKLSRSNCKDFKINQLILSKLSGLCYNVHDKSKNTRKLFLENRVNLNKRNKNKNVYSHFEFKSRDTDIIDLVLKSNDANKFDSDEHNCTSMAKVNNKKKVLIYLVRLHLEGVRCNYLLELIHDYGVNVDKKIVQNRDGLQYSIVASNVLQMMKLLKTKFDVNLKDAIEKPLLHSLKIKCDNSSSMTEITVAQIHLLVDYSAKIYDTLDTTAVNKKFFKYIMYLLSRGAEFKVCYRNSDSKFQSLRLSDIKILEYITTYHAKVDRMNVYFHKFLIYILQCSKNHQWRYEVVDFLLKNGVNVGEDDDLFYEALYSHDIEIVKCLIAHGAKVDSINLKTHRMNALKFAIVCLKGHWRYEIVRLLLENGEIVNDRDSLFFDALRSHDIDIVKCFIDHGANVKLKNHSGVSPLHFLLISYQLNPDQGEIIFPLIRLLTKYGADIDENLSSRDNLYITPLSEAVYYGLPKLVQYLLSLGANPNVSDGNTSLIFEAIRTKDIDIVKCFIDNDAIVDFTDPHIQTTPLLFAFIVEDHQWRYEVVKLLLNNQANIHEVDSYTGMSLVQIALSLKDLKLFYFLIEQGAPVNTKDNRQRSSLFIAVEYSLYDAAETLINMGLDVNDSISLEYDGETRVISIIAVAAREGLEDLVKLLLKNAAKANDDTALQFASLSGNVDIIKLLMENGAVFNPTGENGQICLELALEMSRTEVVKYLLKTGYSVFYKNQCLTSVFEKLSDLFDPHSEDSVASFSIFIKYLAMEILNYNSKSQSDTLETNAKIIESLAWTECGGNECLSKLVEMKNV